MSLSLTRALQWTAASIVAFGFNVAEGRGH
jgi:hypothetical protein